MTTMHRTLNSPAHQTERSRSDQVKNNAGGFVYKLDPIDQLRRFLILGTEGGTFYQSERETYQGSVHADEMLRQYRKKTGINAKLAVIGMTSTGFTIADPRDAGMLDFVGFSSDLPKALESFINL